MYSYRLKTKLGLLVLSASVLSTTALYAESGLVSMTDSEMAATQGQALMNLSYVAPNDPANQNTGKNIGFYKLGLEAEMEINANIKKLQLGCGGVNGANGCDIDIDNLSLSGLGNSATSNTDSAADRNARAGSSAVLTNPFIQFAIKNPNSASTRQMVGVNLSAEKAQGLLTFGSENSTTPNGINSLSGYLQVAPTTGTARVNGFGTSLVAGEAAKGQLNQSDGYNAINGAACCVLGTQAPFSTTAYNLNLRDAATGSNILKGDLILPQQVISGRRINTANLSATASVNNIALTGQINARVRALGFIPIPLQKQVDGTIRNLRVDAAISQNLGLFHKVNLNGTAASLSMQSEDLKWIGNASTAQRGWWLELSNPIDIGRIDPAAVVDIEKATLNEALNQVSNYITRNPIPCGGFIAEDCLFGGTIPVGDVNLINAPAVPMPLRDLQLIQQAFTPNCYGNLKFC